MIPALSIAITGLSAQINKLDTITNNLANVNTTGFKKSRVLFQEQAATKAGIGLGTSVSSIDKLFSQGPLITTENPFDLTIQGDGFFAVTRPDGSTAYTRDGSFKIDGLRRVVTAGGDILQPQITVPVDATSIQIATNGTVSVTRPGMAAPQVIGAIPLVKFSNPGGLLSLGQNLFAEGANSGMPQAGNAGTGGRGVINQGFLEMSNVDIGEEMVNMMLAQRAFEFNLKSIKTSDEMLKSVFDILR
jgi:flagellar basal-body rod protein FlgG